MLSFSDFAQRLPYVYRRARDTIDNASRMGPDRLREFQERQLEKVGRWAQMLPEHPSSSLKRADPPLLTKDDVRARPEAFLRRTFLPTSNKQTSGTSGSALSVRRSIQSVVFEQATLDWLLAQIDIDLSKCRVAVLRASDIKSLEDVAPPYWTYERGGRFLVFSSNHLNPRTVRDYHAALTAFKPDILYIYPSAGEQLARLLEGAGLQFRCAAVLSSSETLTTQSRQRLSEAFAAPVVDYYGQAERVAFAYSLEPEAYRFVPAYSFVELIPREAGQSLEVVGTPFHNAVQVLRRYCTGDIIEPQHSYQSLRDIADGIEPFRGIAGRVNDVLYGPAGEVLVGINHIPRGLDALGRFQIVQKDLNYIEILVQKDGPLSSADEQLILKKARLKLPTAMQVEVRSSDELRRTRAGKTPFIIHEMTP